MNNCLRESAFVLKSILNQFVEITNTDFLIKKEKLLYTAKMIIP